MRAWRVHQLGDPQDALRLDQDAPIPKPAADQVLLRVGCSALNFADGLLCRGEYQVKPDLPFSPGLEVSGEVVSGGESVGINAGRRMMGTTFLPAGGLAEYCLVNHRNLYPVPDDMSDEDASALLIPYQTAHIALHRRGNLQPGETLLVHAGAGGVGSAAIQLGKAAGARVIATAGGASKVEICREIGADVVIDYRTEDFVERVHAETDGLGADVIYDPVGGDIFDRSRKAIAWEGRLLVIGFAGGRIADAPTNHPFIRNYSIVGVYIGEYSHRDHDFLLATHADLMRLYSTGKISPLVHTLAPMEEAGEAIGRLLSRRTTGKVVVHVAGEREKV
ncbi:MAG: alcohol dehydrogenase [Deltaproteobacteria bacterium]|nr:alcohol dehydrogenase [Deltaproteobacteria bacterium]